MKFRERLSHHFTVCPLREELERRREAASAADVTVNSWGALLWAEDDGMEEGGESLFFWYENEAQWLQGMADVLAAFAVDGKLAFARIYRDTRREMTRYLAGGLTLEDVIFRWEGYALEVGLSLLWAGAFSELAYSDHPVAQKTRLFFRAFLADTGVAGVDRSDSSFLNPGDIDIFIACLADFGQGGQGLIDD